MNPRVRSGCVRMQAAARSRGGAGITCPRLGSMNRLARPQFEPRSRVLIVESDPARVGTIAQTLGEIGFEVSTAYRAATALVRVVDERPDAIVVGDRLDDSDPVELIPRLRARAGIPILALAGRLDEALVVALLDAGADDVIGGGDRPAELIARLRALLRRGSGRARPAVESLPDGLRLDLGRREASVHGRAVPLTPIEFELLAVIAARGGDVVEHVTLMRAAWPGRPDADPDLLRTHLAHLNAKLIGAGHPGLRNVRSTGYGLRIEGDAQRS